MLFLELKYVIGSVIVVVIVVHIESTELLDELVLSLILIDLVYCFSRDCNSW